MRRISLLVWIIGISAVTARRNRPSEYSTVDLVITAYQSLGNVRFDGLPALTLTNANNWSLTDHVALPAMSRLITLEGKISSSEPCAGVLASVNDTYLLTSSLWKCTENNVLNWTDLGFDDSTWPNAFEYGLNGNHATCGDKKHFPDISSNAQWIWSSDPSALVVYCRGYLPLCSTSSPCQNGGTCLPNAKKICNCPPEFTGTYCESELMDGTLVITAYQKILSLYIDGYQQPLINSGMWNQTDHAGLTNTNRLIAVSAEGDSTCGGLLASFGDSYVLTNAEWKCSKYQDGGWMNLGFVETGYYLPAVEFGSNGGGHTQCSHLQTIPDISYDAMWIWDADQWERTIFCRGYLPVCDSSPCLNNGTCLKNDVNMCRCVPQFTGTYCETEILTTPRTTRTTTVITTSTLETTTEATTTPATTTEATTIPATTTAATTAATTTPATTTAQTTTAGTTAATTTPASPTTAASTQTTTTTPATTTASTPTVTTPVASTSTQSSTESGSTTTAHATSHPSDSSSTTDPNGLSTSSTTSFTGLVSSTSPGDHLGTGQPQFPTCTTDDYCNGMLEKPGANIEHCACPADYLNVNNNCCMSQNWIIGMCCMCAAILILIFIIIIVCVRHRHNSDKSSFGDSGEDLIDGDRLSVDTPSMDLSYVTEKKKEDHKKTDGGVVDAHRIEGGAGVHAANAGHPAAGNAHPIPGTRRASLASAALGVNTLRGLNPSGEHPLTQYPIYTLARRRGQPAYRSMIERGRREDFFYNPLMVELLSNDIYRHFRPSLGGIPTNVDYSIQRPEIELEFLYNELYGSDLHRGMYDYGSPWSMNVNPNMRL